MLNLVQDRYDLAVSFVSTENARHLHAMKTLPWIMPRGIREGRASLPPDRAAAARGLAGDLNELTSPNSGPSRRAILPCEGARSASVPGELGEVFVGN
jgi:hypothetical protein